MKVIIIIDVTISKTVYIQTKKQNKTELQLHTSYNANNTIPTETRLSIPCFRGFLTEHATKALMTSTSCSNLSGFL